MNINLKKILLTMLYLVGIQNMFSSPFNFLKKLKPTQKSILPIAGATATATTLYWFFHPNKTPQDTLVIVDPFTGIQQNKYNLPQFPEDRPGV